MAASVHVICLARNAALSSAYSLARVYGTLPPMIAGVSGRPLAADRRAAARQQARRRRLRRLTALGDSRCCAGRLWGAQAATAVDGSAGEGKVPSVVLMTRSRAASSRRPLT